MSNLTKATRPVQPQRGKQGLPMPASFRAGLIEALKCIGGAEAEAVLVETLGATARGQDVSCN